MEKVKAWFAQLAPKEKMAAIWGGIALVVIIIVFSTSDEPIVKNIQSLVTPNERGLWGENAEEVTLEGIGTQMASIQEQLSLMSDRDNAQNAQIMSLRETVRDFSNTEENVRNMYEMNRKISSLEQNIQTIADKLDYSHRRAPQYVPDPDSDLADSVDQEDETGTVDGKPKQQVPPIQVSKDKNFINDGVTKTTLPDDPLEFIRRKSEPSGANPSSTDNLYVQNGQQSTQIAPRRNSIEIVTGQITAEELMTSKPSDNYIGRRVLAGSLIPVTVITGVEAPTGKAAESGAVSSTLRIHGPAILPNGYRLDLTGCVVTNNVKGQINTERAYFRPDRLSCQYEFGEVDIPIKGYVTGKDGTQGFRGKIISKQGQALLYGTISGGISGLGQAFGGNNQNGAIIGNVQDPYALPSSEQVLQGSVSGAVSESADFLTQYYQQKLQELHEVVEVKPLIKGSIHILETFQLELMEHIDPQGGATK